MEKTSLALQLKRLQTPQTQLLLQKKKRDSFLFDPKEAATFDRDAIYLLGISGLEELKKLNPNFNAFYDTLFDVTSKYFERSVESSEANEKLNDQIKTFLTLLSPYFLLKPAHKALEWLINRYHINRFNVDDIMFLIFPYHETVLFSRMLQLIRIEENVGKWHWLYQVKRRGVPLSKMALLNRAANDMGFLKFVCDMPAKAVKIFGSRASNLGTLFAFYCTTVVGGLNNADAINELHITNIIPSMLSALSSSIIDYTASGFFIIARLATKTCLSPKVLSVLFNKIVKVAHGKLRSEQILLLLLVCQNNEGKCELSETVTESLAEAPWFIPILASITSNAILIHPFLCLLLTTCIKCIQNGEEKYKTFVQKLLTDVKYDSQTVENIFKVLLEEFNGESSEETVKWFSEVIKCLEYAYPQVFDSVVSAALSDEESKAGMAVKIILGTNTSRNDLFLKLVHPNEDVRLQAIKHIAKHFTPDQIAWLNHTLLDRLKDDSPKVVRQFLRLPPSIISNLPKETLVNNLLVVITRFSSTDEPIVLQSIATLINNTTKEEEALVLIVTLPFIISAMQKSDIIENAPSDRLKFLSVVKSKAAEEANAGLVLWDALVDSASIPPLEEIISALKQSKVLAAHSAFWFSSALLIGSKITDHISLEVAELVMQFLIEFLHFSELDTIANIVRIDETSLGSCFETSIRGKLPIQGALFCLSRLSSCIPYHSSTIRKPWLDSNNKHNAFTLSVYKVLLEGCNSDFKAVRVAFSDARTSFFKNHFPDTEFQILFVLNAVMLDSKNGSKGLNVAKKVLIEDSNLISSILKEQSLVVPSLFILLGSPEESIRSQTLKILTVLTESLCTGFYRPLVEELLNHSTEILLDHEQINLFAYKKLSPSREVRSLLNSTLALSMEHVLSHLLSLITNHSCPSYVKAKLLRILEFVSSKEILLELLPVAIQRLGISEELDENESYVVVSIFKRLNDSIADCFKDEKFWSLLRIALADSKTTILSPDYDKGVCPAALMLHQISKELFDALAEPLQEKLISFILEKATDVENVQVINATASFFKRISLDSKILVSLLTAMLNIFVPYSPNSLRARNRSSVNSLPSLGTLETIEWKKGVCLLELIQNKKKLSNIQLLLPLLFGILKKCLQFEQQAPVEYTKQLLLSSILHACKKLSTSPVELTAPMENLQVDVVVECVRASHNPQTHHHALLALSYIANLIPDQVLHNMMSIFTFIGSSVVRQDDAYSFQLISKIIETIIPILVKSTKGTALEEAVIAVLRVFVATIVDLPEHRRIPLFKKLLVTLNDGKFLWIFLILAFEKHVLTYNAAAVNEDKASMNMILDYALQLCAEFPPPVILKTTLNLLKHVSILPHDKEIYLLNKAEYKTSLIIFNIEENSEKNFRHYKYTLLIFLSFLLSSTTFVQQVSELSDEETSELKELFGSLTEQCLIFLKIVSVQTESCAQLPTAKYWRMVFNQCYDIMDKVLALLPTEIFIEVVGRLLRNPLEGVRRKAMELLGLKLQQSIPLLQSQLKELLDPLISVLESLHSQALEKSENTDSFITQQVALFALKLMARHLSSKYPEDFLKVLAKVTDILALNVKLSGPVFGSLALCLGELVSMQKMHSLPFLPNFMPPLISALHHYSNDTSGESLLLSIVTTVQKIVEVIPQFLSPYLGQLLYEVSILSARYDTEVTDQLQKLQPLTLKLKLIRQKISSEIAVRVLVPAVSSAYSELLKNSCYQAIGPLMTILSDSFTSASDLSSETIKLFLSTLEFRSIQPEPSLEECESVENPVIVAFTKLILKLSESSFRPLYQRIFDWAVRGTVPKERIITFYRLSSQLAKSLKSLFPIFLSIFIENAAEVLKNNNPALGSEEWFDGSYSEEKSILVVENIIETFGETFSHDSQKHLTKDHFNLIMEPLVNQLENKAGGTDIANKRCKNILIPCLANMASSTGDDSLWKRLNYHILLKTRHSSPEVRKLGLQATCSLAAKLGEDFMPLLPETVPFLAELLEDDDDEVENECQKVVNEMEDILGESIQKYF